MLLEPEDAAVVSADAFKNSVPIKQPVIEHRNGGVTFRSILPVDVHFHVVTGAHRKAKPAPKATQELVAGLSAQQQTRHKAPKCAARFGSRNITILDLVGMRDRSTYLSKCPWDSGTHS